MNLALTKQGDSWAKELVYWCHLTNTRSLAASGRGMLVEDDEDADYGYDDDDFEPEESLRSDRQSESPQRSQPPPSVPASSAPPQQVPQQTPDQAPPSTNLQQRTMASSELRRAQPGSKPGASPPPPSADRAGAKGFFGLQTPEPPEPAPSPPPARSDGRATSQIDVANLQAELKEAIAERDEWRRLHAAEADWLVKACVLFEPPKRTAVGVAAVSNAAVKDGGKNRGSKAGGGAKGAAAVAGVARSVEELQVAEVEHIVGHIAEIRSRSEGQRTHMEELVLAVAGMLNRFAKTYTGELQRRRKPAPADASPEQLGGAAAAAAAAGGGGGGGKSQHASPPRAGPPELGRGTSSFAPPVASKAAAKASDPHERRAEQEASRARQQDDELRRLRQKMARLQAANLELSERLERSNGGGGGGSVGSGGGGGGGGGGGARLPALPEARGAGAGGDNMRMGRAGAQANDRSRAEAHTSKHRAAPGGADGAAAGGWAEWDGSAESKVARKRAVAAAPPPQPAAPPPQRTEVPQWGMPASNWSRDALELELAARADELASLSPRSHQQHRQGYQRGPVSSTSYR